jgi:TolA-binding protein
MDNMSANLNVMRQQLQDQQAHAAAEAAASNAAVAEELQQRLSQLETTLQEREQLVSNLQTQVDGAAGLEAAKFTELEEQLQAASERLQYVDNIESKYKWVQPFVGMVPTSQQLLTIAAVEHRCRSAARLGLPSTPHASLELSSFNHPAGKSWRTTSCYTTRCKT